MKQPIRFVLIFFFFLNSGCEDIIDCIINVRPELPDKIFKVGIVNEFYSDDFRAGINNEPRDEEYGYFFELSGKLPEGLDLIIDYRSIIIAGTPTESGTFKFTLYLTVEPPEYYDFETGEYDDPLCSDNTSKTYTLTIQ